MTRSRTLLVAALLLGTSLAGCLQQGSQPGSDDGVHTVEGTEWELTPSNLTVTAGENVTVVYENVGDAAHNWALDLDGGGEPDHQTATIQPGETASVSFTVQEPGEYAYFCDVSGHRDAGMEGALTVGAAG